MKFLSSEKLSQHKYKTPEGYLICTDAILARTGKQTYQRCEVFADAADDLTEIEIDRTAEEVFAPATLASFENKPITVEHPDENVTPQNYNDLSVGFVRDVHKGEVDGQEVMLGTLVITDAQTIAEIENGEHTDLSCGYDCDIIDEAHPQQRNIRGNHVALCAQGRAGIARIVDSVKDGYYWNDIRRLCIQNDWYTNGTNSEYNNMFENARTGKWNAEQIAKDIYEHSSIKVNYQDILNAIKRLNPNAVVNDSVKDDIVFDYTEADLDKAKEMLITAKTDDEKRLIKSLIAKIEFELKSKELNDEDNNNENEDEFIQAHSDAKAMYEEIISREAMTEEEAKRLVYKYFKGKDSIKDNMTSREFDYWSYHAMLRPNNRYKLNRIIDLFYRNGYKLFDYDDEDFYDELSDAYANASSSLKNQINAIIKDSKLVDNSIKDEQKPYGITPRRKWQSSKKIERYATTLEEAKADKNSLEKDDGIDYVVVDTRTMKIVDGKKTFTIKTEDNDTTYIAKIRANNAIEAFHKFNNKK